MGQTLQETIRAAGFVPPENIEPGRIARFSTNGETSDKAGWLYLFPDGEGASFGDWRSGREFTWQNQREQTHTPAERAGFQRKVAQAKQEATAQREKEHQEAAQHAREIWMDAPDAHSSHAYLTRKKIDAEGLRLSYEDAYKGWLIVPVFGPDGMMQSLQFIGHDGTKRFLGGGKMKAGHVWLGNPENATMGLVCEGWATGKSLYEATGFPVCVAFNAGNLGEVAKMVKKKQPRTRLLLCGDDDIETNGNPGRTKATEAAKAIGASLAFPNGGGDFNDMFLAEGAGAVSSQIQKALAAPMNDGVIRLDEWQASKRFQGEPPKREWLIEGIFPLGKPALFASAGGVGKSFLLLDLARGVATGTENCAIGKLEAHGTAVMLCAEDDAIEIHNRLDSLGSKPERLYVVPCPDAGGVPALFGIEPYSKAPWTTSSYFELEAQFRQMPDLRLICFDPLQALCGGLDLNLPQHAQHVCGELARLASVTGATVLVSHHFRKSGKIETPDDAREAIRGTGGLVDGVRSVYALWPAEEGEGKSKCETLGVPWHRGRVVKGGVVKANFKADFGIAVFVRDESGILRDRRMELGLLAPKRNDLKDALRDAVGKAAEVMKPFTKTGKNGLHERRNELPKLFHEMGRQRLEDMAQELLNERAVVKCRKTPKETAPGNWLDIPGGALARQSEEFAKAELAKREASEETSGKGDSRMEEAA